MDVRRYPILGTHDRQSPFQKLFAKMLILVCDMRIQASVYISLQKVVSKPAFDLLGQILPFVLPSISAVENLIVTRQYFIVAFNGGTLLVTAQQPGS